MSARGRPLPNGSTDFLSVFCSAPLHIRRLPDDRILVDEAGLDTRRTVRNVSELAASREWASVLFVSHGYHLARIKMFSERLGLRGYTVPAEETRPLARRRYYFARELAALAWYYLQPA